MITLYEKLPSDVLTQFYFEIKNNIDKGILSDAMYQELELIKVAALKRGFTILEKKRQ
ncbi:hypothetical protein GMB86_12860 [Terrilactibacillus sp. BCM23-1]|uniref:Sporulation histidine kinase inhibitor Sda n=1 Tax=Terrilactibacillus tamarindi TaxID=2599694 RepID=A0A6N8CUC1_9BACI|nr:hypothetical protein [Terrilactibacillus tamarindi]MTT32897.1 hypothetical protein [Terrilactibacillus tamarindi]